MHPDICQNLIFLISYLSFTQTIRALGLLGALDPYKHKVNQGYVESRDGGVQSTGESKGSQDCKYKEGYILK